jgi:hypothetical protein
VAVAAAGSPAMARNVAARAATVRRSMVPPSIARR